MISKIKYKRVLLKLSGEALLGNNSHGIDEKIIAFLADEIKKVYLNKIQISVVIGGGNIFRGTDAASVGIERTTADYMGMLGTVMNSLAMQNSLERIDVESRVQSAITMTEICESYSRRRAIRHMEKNRVVIFAAGTGNPYFTTDTAAALRASEMSCDAIFKGTLVNGIYDKDPKKYDDAIKFDKISFHEVLTRNLRVIDSAAVSLARENDIPIVVFSINEENSFVDIMEGKGNSSIVTS